MFNFPFISIIIPALNAEKTIIQCLESINKICYPKNRLEIILVDNGSKDRTKELAKTYCDIILYKPDLKIGELRNCGAEISKGEILAHTDSDCVVPTNWLLKAVEILQDINIGAVGGGCLVPESASWIERAWVDEQKNEIIKARHLPACNFIVKNKLFKKIGGFDENLVAGEDDNLSERIQKEGFSIISQKSCYVVHLGYPKTLVGIAKRQMWHGRSSIESKESILDKTFVSSSIFALCLICLPFAFTLSFYRFIIIIILILVILFVPIVASFYKSLIKKHYNRGLKRFLMLIPIFFSYYIGRSLGLILNCIDRFNRPFKKQ